MALATHHHLAPRFKDCVDIYLYSPLGFHGLFSGDLYLAASVSLLGEVLSDCSCRRFAQCGSTADSAALTAVPLCLETGSTCFNPLMPNGPYSGRTAPLTSKRCILYIYSTNIGTEYFKHGIGLYSPFFSLQNAVFFHNSNVFGSCIIHILYTGVLKFKKKNPAPKS